MIGKTNSRFDIKKADRSIDLSTYDVYGNQVLHTTANCYIVKETGAYKLPLVFGNALKNGIQNSAAYTKNSGSYSHDFVDYKGNIINNPFIEIISGDAASAQLSITDTDGVFDNISIIDGELCRYLKFEVKDIPATGANGILSIKDSNGIIMWNWHIWVWTESLTTVQITNNTNVKYNIFPYCLASKWDNENKTTLKHWFYQFGRPTPLLCPSAWNLSSNHSSFGVLSFNIQSGASSISQGITNPTIFYKYTSNENWFSQNSSKTLNLWDADCSSNGLSDNNVKKTIYDPSPIGFKMPNGNTFTGFKNIKSQNGHAYFTRYSGDNTGFPLPLSGARDYTSGSIIDSGVVDNVWTSASRNYNGVNISYSSSVIVTNHSSEAYGFAVLPVKE